jgi:hypothetical protein
MKETVRSLRAYFIIAGLYSAYLNGKSLAASPGLIGMVLDGAAFLIALSFFYFGAALPSLLATSTNRVNLGLAASAALSIAHGGLSLLLGGGGLQHRRGRRRDRHLRVPLRQREAPRQGGVCASGPALTRKGAPYAPSPIVPLRRVRCGALRLGHPRRPGLDEGLHTRRHLVVTPHQNQVSLHFV